MSREAWQKIVNGAKGWNPEAMYGDYVCLEDVSKVIRGESRVGEQDVQQCPNCKTLKRLGEFRMEIESGPCDSKQSASMLNGQAQGRLVTAYRDGDMSNRGGLSGMIEWQGQGAVLLGRTFAMLNAGTHYDPVSRGCEECHAPGHAEGWLRAAIVEGDCEGCRVNGSIAYQFRASDEGSEFMATFEGLLI